MSAKVLFRHLQKHFIGHVVMLQIKGDQLVIDNRVLPARREEQNDSPKWAAQ